MRAPISRRALLRLASSTLALSLLPAAVSRAAAGASWLPGRASAVEAAVGSLVYEEYRGDLARARRLAEDALAGARRNGGAGTVADALLALGLVELLAGESGGAFGRFRELEELVPGDRDRVLWARTGALAAFLLQFNTFPDGTGAKGDEVDRRRYGTADLDRSRLAEILGRQHEAAARASERTRLRCELVKQLFYSTVLARDFASFGFDQRTAGEPSPLAVMAASQAVQGLGAAAEALGDDRPAAYVLVVAADAARRLGSREEAEALLAGAEEAYREAGDAVGLAVVQMLRGDWWAAPLSTPSALNLALGASPNADSSLGWAVEDAEIARSGLDPARARVAYVEAERGFRRAAAPRGVAAVDLRYGYLATIEGDHRGALAAYGRAVEGFGASGDGLGLWSARIHHALARVGAGERPEDRETARALGTWGAGSGAFGYALGLGTLCSRVGRHWLLRAGDYERALACHRLAEAIHGALGATVNHAQSVVDQGVVFREVGERAAAVTLLGRAADLYRGAALGPDGVVAPAAGRLVAVLNDLYQAHVAARDADGQERVAAEMTALVDRLGEAGTGTDATDPMLSVRLAFQGRAVIAQAAVTVPTLRGIQARDRGEAAEAERQFDRALASARGSDPANGDPDFLEAIVERARKDYPASQRAFARYVERLLGGGGREGGLIDQLRQLDPGRAGGEARKQVQRTHEQALAFYVTIEAYPAARPHLEALQALGGQDWWQATDQPWQTLADVGLLYEGLGEHGQAARRYRQAVELHEGRRERLRRDELKTAIASGLGPQYLYFQAARNAVDGAAAAGSREERRGLLAEGFGYAERGKARGLLDLMAGVVPGGSTDEGVGASVRAWREASARVSTWRGLLATERGRGAPEAARIAYLGERIEAEEETLRRIDGALSASDPAFHQAISAQGSVLDVRGVAEGLPTGTALLQYAFLGNDLLAWAVNRDGLLQAHRARVDAKALELQIRTLHGRCETRAPVGEVSAPLARTLLEPLAGAIDAHPDLVVVPYGAAHVLPFHALPWRGEPLVATHTVSYLPSASTLQYVRRGRGGGLSERLLAVGNPAAMAYQPPFGAPPEPQPPLPASAVEAVRVAGLFPQGRALIGPEATVEAVRAAIPEHRLLHFATHGHLSEDAPLLSAILLADGGALTVYDLVGLRLDADLVVLSACRTGQGATTGGDDVLGLTRGLLAAGARAAVVSLWPVDDLATSLLMERFYRDLRAGRAAEAALQSAQNALRGLSREQVREESRRVAESARGVVLARPSSPAGGDDTLPYAHPYYWAPFVLVG